MLTPFQEAGSREYTQGEGGGIAVDKPGGLHFLCPSSHHTVRITLFVKTHSELFGASLLAHLHHVKLKATLRKSKPF